MPSTASFHFKHRNQVRIIAGTHRGRKISFVSAAGLRPTPDSVRERLFNWLGQDLTGQSVLDLFSGSGALGFEAASRSAAQVWLCDNHYQTIQQLHHTAQTLGLSERMHICHQEGLTFLRSHSHTFHTVFLDPPFAWHNWAELFLVLKPRLATQAAVYIEAAAQPTVPDWLQLSRQGKAGQSTFALYYLHTND